MIIWQGRTIINSINLGILVFASAIDFDLERNIADSPRFEFNAEVMSPIEKNHCLTNPSS